MTRQLDNNSEAPPAAAAPPLISATEGNLPARLVSPLLLVTMVAASIPLTLVGIPRVAGLPYLDLLFLALFVLVLAGRGTVRIWNSKAMALFVLAVAWMMSLGIARSEQWAFSWKYFVFDAMICGGVIVGFGWSRQLRPTRLVRNLNHLYLITTLILLTSVVAFRVGLFTSSSSRELDPANFASAFTLSISFPFLYSVRAEYPYFRRHSLNTVMHLSGILVCMAFGYFSGTRSVALVAAMALYLGFLVGIQRSHGRATRIAYHALLLLLALALVSRVDVDSLGILGTRFERTDLDSETRFQEVQWISHSLTSEEWLTGTGFGHGFYSPLSFKYGELVLAPHIGISAWLFKGGVFVFLLVVVLPLLWIFTVLISANRPYVTRCSIAALAVYYLQASLSGGYSFAPLLMVGIFFEIGLRRECKPADTGLNLQR